MTKSVKSSIDTSVSVLQQEKVIAALTMKVALMKKLTTTVGFYEVYYKFLSNYDNKNEAFDYINQMYFSFFGVYRFETFFDFLSKIAF